MKIHLAIVFMFVVLLLSIFVGCKSNDINSDDTTKLETSSIFNGSENEEYTENDKTNEENADKNSTDDELSTSSNVDVSSKTQSDSDTSVISQNTPSTSDDKNSTPTNLKEKNKEDDDLLTFEEYLSLTAAQQQEYYKSFESVDAFADWYRTAQQEYKENDDSISLGGDGTVDLNELLK